MTKIDIDDIDPIFLASKVPSNTQKELATKTLRRDIVKLYVSDKEEDKEELDRAYIALYRLQTEGRVAYRRLLGTHGGGGGAKNVELPDGRKIQYDRILARKVKLDLKHHYNNIRPELSKWPDKTPHGPSPKVFSRKEGNQNPFTYTFCWHGRVEFSVWHRPMMREYERLLQQYDPLNLSEAERYTGSQALGVHYWAWNEWDGEVIPDFANTDEYTIRTDKFKDIQNGIFAKGNVIRNPYRRWTAPVSVKQQKNEYFPEVSEAPTTRNGKFEKNKFKLKKKYPWHQKSTEKHPDPTLKETIELAMTEPRFRFFSSTEFIGNRSIEHPHNKFHNYIGGGTEEKTKFGTMGTTQSPFDPIFMAHHSNVDRHLTGWQRKFWNKSNKYREVSKPSPVYAQRKLFPWTKPNQLEKGMSFWNTRPGLKNNQYAFTGTLEEWFDLDLTYVYEDYVQPPENGDILSREVGVLRLRLTKYLGGGSYVLYLNNIGTSLDLLNSEGGDCANCERKKKKFNLKFPIKDIGGIKAINEHIKEARQAKRTGDSVNERRARKMELRLEKDEVDVTKFINWTYSKAIPAKEEKEEFKQQEKEAEKEAEEPEEESLSDIEEERILAEDTAV